MTEFPLLFGDPDEWAAFQQRNSQFISLYPNLATAFGIAFFRAFTSDETIDVFVMTFGRLCLEDFSEILMCCGNGYGIAGSKLLRALYEKAVTLSYINDNQGELEAFINYHAVSQRKLFISLKSIYGSERMPQGSEDRITAEFEAVKDQFMITDCEKCGSRRLNHTWSKLDFVGMAKKTPLARQINQAYYVPMRRTHATLASLEERLQDLGDTTASFNPDAQRQCADQVLRTTHRILIEVLKIQDKRFSLIGLRDAIEKCLEDYVTIWKGKALGDGSEGPV
jgi:hypothetical protein